MEVQRREFLVGLTAALSGCVSDSQPGSGGDVTDGGVDEDTLYHVSTVDALRCGHLSDEKTVDELVENGDWGLGTVNGVDGELAVVDGEAYAVRGDGTADKLDGTTKTPFAAVTEFEPDDTVEIEEIGGFEDFAESVTEELPRTDYFYALRVEGTFDFLRTRSVDRQVEPYPTLEEVIENETVFEFEDVEGNMPTFFVPDQFEGIHPPGYHAHFVTDERDGGGHVYDLRADSLTVEVDYLESVHLELAEREVEEYPPC
jgi:acetolactate decarboxylase